MKSIYLFSFIICPFIIFSQKSIDGWTILDKKNASKIIYVSSTDGNDDTGVVYDPSALEIGEDPIHPSGVIMSFKTIAAAASMINNGEAAWILLKRGDSFYESLIPKPGLSKTQPMVYSSYGSSNELPLLNTGNQPGINVCCRSFANFWVVGISFYAHTRNPDGPDYILQAANSSGFAFFAGETYVIDNILIEGCVFRFFEINKFNSAGVATDIKIRRNLILDNYSNEYGGHSQGLFGQNLDGMLLEENIFDHNGWYKQSINSDNAKEGGQATIFNHNTYFAYNHNITFTGNSFYRPSSICNKWTASDPASTSGITITNNFYHDYEVGISMGGNSHEPPYRFKNIDVSKNVFDQPNVSLTTNRQLGWMMGIQDWDNGIFNDNLLINQNNANLGNCSGISIDGQNRDLTIQNNILYNLKNASYFSLGGIGRVKDPGGLTFENTTITENKITMPSTNASYILYSREEFIKSIFNNNTYNNFNTSDEKFTVIMESSERINMNFNKWTSDFEPGANTTEIIYPDPTRSLDRYIAEVLGLSSKEQFYANLRKQSRLNWNPEYMAPAINAWIKEGFNISSDDVNITTSTLTNGMINTPYSQTLTAFGGNGTLTWTLANGSLPQGLTLASTGEISGTPTAAENTTFTVRAADSNGNSDTQELTLAIVASSIPEITTTTLPDGNQNQVYNQTLAASNGDGTLTWSLNGTLPQGLTLASTGEISGTPTVAENTTFSVTVTDGDGDADTQDLSININAAAANSTPEITTTALPDGNQNQVYNQNLAASNGDGTLTWSLNGTLPQGLTLASTGEISGTPTVAENTTFSVTVTDADGDADTQNLSININAAAANSTPEITTTSLPDGNQNQVYNQTLVASNGNGTLTWSVTSGSLPQGLSITNTGEIFGTPTAAENSTFTVTATDTDGDTDTQDLSIIIIAFYGEISAKKGFSPNNDGINDIWQIIGIEEYPNNIVQIFNRWGNIVFEISGYDNSNNYFDGNANKLKSLGASELPDGTYFFSIDLNTQNSSNTSKGFLIIKR